MPHLSMFSPSLDYWVLEARSVSSIQYFPGTQLCVCPLEELSPQVRAARNFSQIETVFSIDAHFLLHVPETNLHPHLCLYKVSSSPSPPKAELLSPVWLSPSATFWTEQERMGHWGDPVVQVQKMT